MITFEIETGEDRDSVRIEVNGKHRGRIDSYHWSNGNRHLISILDDEMQRHGILNRIDSGIMIDGKPYGICADHFGLSIGPME